MKDKKTGVAIFVSIVVILLIFGGASFLAKLFSGEQNKQTNAMTQQNQLQMQDVNIGTGAIATAGKDVTVHYTGVFASDGKKFDSSLDRGQPFTFKLGAGQVIKGWDMGVEGMKVGGKRILVIPPEFGYGANDYGPIPGNSTLIFYVELLNVK